MYEKIILDINPYLVQVEQYFINGLDIAYQDVLKDCRFIPNRRYPIKDIKECSNPEVIRSTPYYPFLCLDMVSQYLKIRIYQESGYSIEFKANKLLNDKGVKFLEDYENPEDVISLYINTKNMDINYFKELVTILDRIFLHVDKYTSLYPKNIFEFEYETQYFVLVNKGEIGSFRYNEAIEYNDTKLKQLEMELETKGGEYETYGKYSFREYFNQREG